MSIEAAGFSVLDSMSYQQQYVSSPAHDKEMTTCSEDMRAPSHDSKMSPHCAHTTVPCHMTLLCFYIGPQSMGQWPLPMLAMPQIACASCMPAMHFLRAAIADLSLVVYSSRGCRKVRSTVSVVSIIFHFQRTRTTAFHDVGKPAVQAR